MGGVGDVCHQSSPLTSHDVIRYAHYMCDLYSRLHPLSYSITFIKNKETLKLCTVVFVCIR